MNLTKAALKNPSGVGFESLIEVRGGERLQPGQSVVISSGENGSPAG